MFQFTGFPSARYGFTYGCMRSSHAGFPIQTPADHRVCAPLRSFSQLIASFFGSQCQGILPVLFPAWPPCCIALQKGAVSFLFLPHLFLVRPRMSLLSFLIKILIRFCIRFSRCFPRTFWFAGTFRSGGLLRPVGLRLFLP